MALRTQIDIDMYQGDDQSYSFTLYTDVAQTTKYNISAATEVRMTVKDSLAPGAPTLFASPITTPSSGGNDWTNGLVVIPVSAANAALVKRDAVYDIQVSIASTKVSPVYGKVVLRRQVS